MFLEKLLKELNTWPDQYLFITSELQKYILFKEEYELLEKVTLKDSRTQARIRELAKESKDAQSSFVNSFEERVTSSDPKTLAEMCHLPGFFKVFHLHPSSTLMRKVLARPEGLDAFLESHKPTLNQDGSVKVESALNPADSILNYHHILSCELAAQLWRLVEEELTRSEAFGYPSALDMSESSAMLDLSQTNAPRLVAKLILGVEGHSQEFVDDLSFKDPLRRKIGDRLPINYHYDEVSGAFSSDFLYTFSEKALAFYFKESQPHKYADLLEDKGIDVKVADMLIPSWEGDFESLCKAALTLSAEQL